MKVRLEDLMPNDTIVLDSGFTCCGAGYKTVMSDDHGLYFECDAGKHYLDGQIGEDGFLVGVSVE